MPLMPTRAGLRQPNALVHTFTDGLYITSTRAQTHRELIQEGLCEQARVRRHCGPLYAKLVTAGIGLEGDATMTQHVARI